MSNSTVWVNSNYINKEQDMEEEVKKPGFFKRWFKRMVNEVLENDQDYATPKRNRSRLFAASDDSFRSEPLSFKVYKANGGMVIETISYDRKRDITNSQLHIIPHEEDLGSEISKIITIEALRS